MAQEGKLSRKEKKEIRIKRRALRKDLRKRGIKSREEFEIIARQLGLVYGDPNRYLIPWWIRWWGAIKALGMTGLVGALLIGGGLLTITFMYASLANQKGNFTVAVSGNLLNVGFDLSDTPDFERPRVRLKSEVLKEVNAMSVEDLPDNLDRDFTGSHNMDNVVAYTFWIRNAGDETLDYDWYMVLNAVTKNLDEAVWMMIYDEGYQTIYAKPVPGTEEPEHLSGYTRPPLYDQAANPEEQYYQNADGEWGIRTTPYLEDRLVGMGTEMEFEPGETHKYTVVIWVEGDDPECIDDILGSHAGFSMKFTISGEDRDTIFDDLIFDDMEPYTGQEEESEEETRK